MNILRHKKWHVRTKENVARVRRDEAKAAEEEKARAERAELADHEDRIQRLRSKNIGNTSDVESVKDIFGVRGDSKDVMGGTSSSTSASNEHHVNLFKELEEQERKNFANGNKEYAAEKKKEQDDWESKVGIMKRFAEDTKEYSKDNEWWEGIPLMREHDDKKPSKVSKSEKKFLTSEEQKAIKLKKEKKKKRKDKIKGIEHAQPCVDINLLRQERLARERREQQRVIMLTKQENKDDVEESIDKMVHLNKDRDRRYNSQFNPEFSRF
uniref:CBF1-interacting co-repressor CIR N-terminal domain-containing protein n=1 Tax=Meloidogyne enterolobii TaxID=390850 RepID=A0A6V7XU30_MELEN|nr:unnamed protein product [Meloidogyne enterolobii]